MAPGESGASGSRGALYVSGWEAAAPPADSASAAFPMNPRFSAALKGTALAEARRERARMISAAFIAARMIEKAGMNTDAV